MAEKIKDLQELLTKSGIQGEVLDQEVSYLVAPGENFGSMILKVEITLGKDGGKKELIHAVAKCVPRNPVAQAIFQTQITFKNEIHWYETIIPIFMDFQKECGMEKTADFFQKFFGARISLDANKNYVDVDGLLLTENLVNRGYTVYDRQVGFDLDTAKVLLKDLAVFHALFIGIKNKKPEVFETKIKPTLQGFEMNAPSNDAPSPFDKVYEVLEEEPEMAPFIPRVKENAYKHNPFADDESEEGPWMSVSHNDFWTNNVMIKDGPPKEAVILDLQITRYKSVAADVIFFLLSSVEVETYKKYYEILLIHYYDTFVDTLTQVKVDTAEYSFDGFLKEIEHEAIHGQFAHAFLHTIFLMADKNTEGKQYAAQEDADMVKDFVHMTTKLNKKTKEKFKFLILEAVKHNWV